MLVRLAKKKAWIYWVTNHVEPIPWRIASNDIDLLVRIEPHDVFQSDYMIN